MPYDATNACYKCTDLTRLALVIDRFATTAAGRLNFLIWTCTCTSVHCTVQ